MLLLLLLWLCSFSSVHLWSFGNYMNHAYTYSSTKGKKITFEEKDEEKTTNVESTIFYWWEMMWEILYDDEILFYHTKNTLTHTRIQNTNYGVKFRLKEENTIIWIGSIRRLISFSHRSDRYKVQMELKRKDRKKLHWLKEFLPKKCWGKDETDSSVFMSRLKSDG